MPMPASQDALLQVEMVMPATSRSKAARYLFVGWQLTLLLLSVLERILGRKTNSQLRSLNVIAGDSDLLPYQTNKQTYPPRCQNELLGALISSQPTPVGLGHRWREGPRTTQALRLRGCFHVLRLELHQQRPFSSQQWLLMAFRGQKIGFT